MNGASGDVAGMRATGSFDWTVNDVFLPERRTMVHAGIPLDNQWKRWPGISYAIPAQAWVGPHHSAVITGIARAGIEALIELAAAKTPRGRGAGAGRLCESPQVQDAVGRADTILNAGRAYRSVTVADVGIGKARYLTSDWLTLSMSTLPIRRLRQNPPRLCLRRR